jgi:hypothetical protein
MSSSMHSHSDESPRERNESSRSPRGTLPSKESLLRMKSRRANRDQLDLKEHLSSHTKYTGEQLDDSLTRYNADSDAETKMKNSEKRLGREKRFALSY